MRHRATGSHAAPGRAHGGGDGFLPLGGHDQKQAIGDPAVLRLGAEVAAEDAGPAGRLADLGVRHELPGCGLGRRGSEAARRAPQDDHRLVAVDQVQPLGVLGHLHRRDDLGAPPTAALPAGRMGRVVDVEEVPLGVEGWGLAEHGPPPAVLRPFQQAVQVQLQAAAHLLGAAAAAMRAAVRLGRNRALMHHDDPLLVMGDVLCSGMGEP